MLLRIMAIMTMIVFYEMISVPLHAACWSAPGSYACDTFGEAYDYAANYCSENNSRYTCGLFPEDDAEHKIVMIMAGSVDIVNKTDGTCCDVVCNGKKQSLGGAYYSRICSDASNPCCGSPDAQCGKIEPTAGNPHGDKSRPPKKNEEQQCVADNESNDSAKAGKP